MCSETIWYNPLKTTHELCKILENTVLKILSINVANPMLYKEEQTHALEDYIETSNATKVVI